MLVEQQHFGAGKRRHDQRHRLPLTAGKQVHAVLHPIFEAEVERGNAITEMLAALRSERRDKAAPLTATGRQRKVLLNRKRAAASR